MDCIEFPNVYPYYINTAFVLQSTFPGISFSRITRDLTLISLKLKFINLPTYKKRVYDVFKLVWWFYVFRNNTRMTKRN